MKATVQKSVGFVISLVFLAGCTPLGNNAAGGKGAKVMQIRWQRLVDEKGQTCDRCGTTEAATEDAVKKLRRALKQLDVDVVLEKTALSSSAFSKDPLQSNRIWIAGKPIEEWLQATVGKSQCSGTCGDSECRTVTVDGKTYNAIPAELIVKAGLLAGAQLVASKPRNLLNPLEEWGQEPPPCCPPSLGGGSK